MRTPLVAGNWKMNGTQTMANEWAVAFLPLIKEVEGVEVAICPPFTALGLMQLKIKDRVALGAQDVFWQEEGAFTGSISPKMLAALDVTYVIVGHSETRGRFGKLEVDEVDLGYFSETDRTINHKVKGALKYDLRPILCVGETIAEREQNDTETVIEQQISGALSGLDPTELGDLVVAYEPVWAIGTGETCAADEANRVCAFIRNALTRYVEESSTIRVLYGGSVKPGNAAELFDQADIDGGLVGGASLDPASFAQIVHAAQ